MTESGAARSADVAFTARKPADGRRHLNWAFRALDRLIKSVGDEVRPFLAGGNAEAYVVVFGKTQVGKTTLLLELMGVAPEAMQRVSTVLRGGRSRGQSATATVMEYGRSPDSAWWLQQGRTTASFDTDDAATLALAELRLHMEGAALVFESPVRVSIPSDCFTPTRADELHVRMLDLPGDQAANPVERRHVAQMAGRYVPGADLILLVGRIDDLGFMKPGGLALPGIEDWQIVPDRFRIVSTYSFTSESMRDYVRTAAEGLTPGVVRERLLQQLGTFVTLTPEARSTNRLFPLEFGESLDRAARYAPELAERVRPLVHELKAELLADIRASATPLARLRAALQSHLIVARVKQAQLAEQINRLAMLDQRAEAARTDLEMADKALLRSQKRVKPCQEQLEGIKTGAPGPRLAIDADAFSNKFKNVDPTTVGGLKARIEDYRAWVRGEWSRLEGDFHGQCIAIVKRWPLNMLAATAMDGRAIDLAIDKDFGAISTRLEGYFLDSYLIPSNRAEDQKSLRLAIKTSAESLTREFQKKRKQVLKVAVDRWEQDLDNAKKAVRSARALRARLRGVHEQCVDFVTRAIAERDACQARLSADEARCATFTALLEEEYRVELDASRRRIGGHPSPSSAFIELLNAAQMVEARSHLFHHAGASMPITSPSPISSLP
ncbi:hypothetical protein QTI51_37290 [Variovorax sp. J22G73]|uniref:hypothetical protein n=1 Tax=unclassified Variovorax TaxID=663243 RepID=UPI0025790CA3|nr:MULTISPECIES: hypothetical protein [unclassified Variovorax]MDM0010157.1 hypothetical protein [Variovorax sp. J22R203]MDM0102981.1 hypothetical protein [Variovorax sp. J22G73]